MTNLEREGYLVIEGLFASDDLLPVKDEFSILIDHQPQKLYQSEQLSDLHQDEPFERRLA